MSEEHFFTFYKLSKSIMTKKMFKIWKQKINDLHTHSFTFILSAVTRTHLVLREVAEEHFFSFFKSSQSIKTKAWGYWLTHSFVHFYLVCCNKNTFSSKGSNQKNSFFTFYKSPQSIKTKTWVYWLTHSFVHFDFV